MKRLLTYASMAVLSAATITPGWAQNPPPGAPAGPPKEDRKAPEAAKPARPEAPRPAASRPEPRHAEPPHAAPSHPAPHRPPPAPYHRPPAPRPAAAPVHPAGPPPRPEQGRPPSGPPQHYHIGAYRPPPGYYHRSWSTGVVLPQPFRVQTYWLLAYATYGLAPPEPGAHWIRVDDDALLVQDDTGQILAVQPGIFY